MPPFMQQTFWLILLPNKKELKSYCSFLSFFFKDFCKKTLECPEEYPQQMFRSLKQQLIALECNFHVNYWILESFFTGFFCWKKNVKEKICDFFLLLKNISKSHLFRHFSYWTIPNENQKWRVYFHQIIKSRVIWYWSRKLILKKAWSNRSLKSLF